MFGNKLTYLWIFVWLEQLKLQMCIWNNKITISTNVNSSCINDKDCAVTNWKSLENIKYWFWTTGLISGQFWMVDFLDYEMEIKHLWTTWFWLNGDHGMEDDTTELEINSGYISLTFTVTVEDKNVWFEMNGGYLQKTVANSAMLTNGYLQKTALGCELSNGLKWSSEYGLRSWELQWLYMYSINTKCSYMYMLGVWISESQTVFLDCYNGVS